MLEIITGIISGTVSATGMGGGTILILILSVFMGTDQHVAQATNLVFFIPTSIVAILFNIKNKKIKWNVAIPVTICGIIGAVIGANVANNINQQQLKKYFGYFLAIITIHEIYSLSKEYIFKLKKQ